MPKFTHSNFFTLIITPTIIELIIIVLVSAFFIKLCHHQTFSEFKESGVYCVDTNITFASIVKLTTFIIPITVMPVLACDTFTIFAKITLVVFSCYITTPYFSKFFPVIIFCHA